MKLLGKIPNKINIAFSGGIDSVVVTHFLAQSPTRDITLFYFNHGTEHGNFAQTFCRAFSERYELPLVVGSINHCRDRQDNESKEEYWRYCRYKFLNRHCDAPMITCHHLDDEVETWLFSALHNYPKLIPYRRDNIIRPFLLTKKNEIQEYAVKRKLRWTQDESNFDKSYPRNRIRHNIVPEALKINPGLYKVIARKVQEEYNVKEIKESS